MFPAAALLYRRRHVHESSITYSWTPRESQLFEEALPPGHAKALRIAAERGRLVTTLPSTSALPWLRATPAPAGSVPVERLPVAAVQSGGAVTSANGELRRSWADGVFSIDAPRSQAACGNLGGRTIQLSDVTLRMRTSRASVAVQTLDDKPIRRSNDILISMASSSFPSEGSQPPFFGDLAVGDIEIHTTAPLTAVEQAGVQVKGDGGLYTVHFDGKAATHWVRLRHARSEAVQ